MELTVSWVNATRLGQERERVEMAYQDRLLELFDSAANAFVSKQEFERHHHPVGHTWQKYNILAHVEATKNLLPSENAWRISALGLWMGEVQDASHGPA